jgi:hypothetical protein
VSILLTDVILIILGIFKLKDNKVFLKAILYIPGFVWMWLGGILLSLQHHSWLRVREPQPVTAQPDFKDARLIKPIKVN